MAYVRAAENTIHKAFARSIPPDVRLIFGYGSGIFKQLGHGDEKANMLDYVVVVDNPVSWHEQNLALNRRHYSFLRYGGAKFLSEIQRGFGASVYFNSLVPFEDRLVKYGVIATADLKKDLQNWTTLYISGRLHKPVLVVEDALDPVQQDCLRSNLQAAVQTSFLLLPDAFTDEDLFLTIAGLSYAGDFRMKFGEDKNKVRNIVIPHMERFHELYRPILEKLPEVDCSANCRTFWQDGSPAARYTLLSDLPLNVRDKVVRNNLKGNRNKDISVILNGVAHSADIGKSVSAACHDIVSYSSRWQSAKGIFTAGLIKSVKYGSAKVRKMLKSL